MNFKKCPECDTDIIDIGKECSKCGFDIPLYIQVYEKALNKKIKRDEYECKIAEMLGIEIVRSITKEDVDNDWDIMKICPKCSDTMVLSHCSFCKADTISTGMFWDEWSKMSTRQQNEIIQLCREYLISDTYDSGMLKRKEEWEERKRAEQEQVSNLYNTGPRCPYCNSNFTQKIGTWERALDAKLFGFASEYAGRTHKCNSCGATW